MFIEREYREKYGFEIGFDSDEFSPQLVHVCYPYFSYMGTLCKTTELWFHSTETENEITCLECCKKFEIIKNKINNDNNFKEAYIVVKSLKKEVQDYFDISYAMTEYFWALTHPKEMQGLKKFGDERTAEWQLKEIARLLNKKYTNEKFDYIGKLHLKTDQDKMLLECFSTPDKEPTEEQINCIKDGLEKEMKNPSPDLKINLLEDEICQLKISLESIKNNTAPNSDFIRKDSELEDLRELREVCYEEACKVV